MKIIDRHLGGLARGSDPQNRQPFTNPVRFSAGNSPVKADTGKESMAAASSAQEEDVSITDADLEELLSATRITEQP